MVTVRALGILVRRNARRRRTQVVAMVLLSLLAAALLNLGLAMATAYPRLVDDKLSASAAEDQTTLLPAGPGADDVLAALRSSREVRDIEVLPVQVSFVDLAYGGEKANFGVMFLDAGRQPRMGRWRVLSQHPSPVPDPVYAPYVFSRGGGYRLGDPITFTTPRGAVTRHIQGFVEEPMMGMPSMGMLGFVVPPDGYRALSSDAPWLTEARLVKLRAAGDHQGLVRAESEVLRAYNAAHPTAQVRPMWGTSTRMMAEGALIGANVFAGSMVLFALIVLAVALVVMRFLVINTVTDDLQRFGILRATGVTTGQLIAQLAGTYTAAAATGAVAGVAISYAVLPVIADSMGAQTGLLWHSGILWGPGLATVAALTVAVLGFAVLSTLRVRRMTTLTALRGGARSHTFARNPFPLERAALSVNRTLGLKAVVQRLPQSLLVAGTMVAVAASMVLAIGMATNLLGNPTTFTHLVVGDVPEAQVYTRDAASARRVLAAAERLPGVDRAFLGQMTGVTVNDVPASLLVMDDFDLLRYDSVYEGREPRHANEVALGPRLAELLDARVGQVVTMTVDGRRGEWLVTGLTSSGRSLGSSLDLVTSGAKAAVPTYEQRSVSLQIGDDARIGSVLDTLGRQFGDDVELLQDNKASIDAQLAGYLSMVGALAYIVVGFMTLVAVLVIALVVTTMVVQSRRPFGVLKAVGFTTRDLAGQTRMTFLPAVAAGAAAGSLLGTVLLDPLMGLGLSSVGVMQVDFHVPWTIPLLLTVVLLLLSAAVMQLAARGLARISAQALVTE